MNFEDMPSPQGYCKLPDIGVTRNIILIFVFQVHQSKKTDLLAEPLYISKTELLFFAGIT